VHTTSAGRSAAPAAPTRSTSRALLAVAACAVVLTLLGWAVVTHRAPLMSVDRSVSTALYVGDDRSLLVWVLLQVATGPGSFGVRMVLFLPVLVWLVLRRSWWTAAWVLTATALVSPLTDVLKELVGRQRPQFAEGGARYESLSFPSGHCSGIATLVTVALVLGWPLPAPAARRVWLAVGVVLVVLVGLTRMWLGVHFVSDVVGGWALGLGWTLLVVVAFGALPGGRAALPGRPS
jgi:membrane-associated phospholipid phosphatase